MIAAFIYHDRDSAAAVRERARRLWGDTRECRSAAGLVDFFVPRAPSFQATRASYAFDSSARIHVLADARIDDRDNLARRLGVRGARSAAEWLIAAYRRDGARMVDALVGDFAFIIADERSGQVYAARDHFGVRPLNYGTTREGTVLASEADTCLRLAELPDDLDEYTIADALILNNEDKERTQYTAVKRLRPANAYSTAGRGLVHVSQYWHPDQIPVNSRLQSNDIHEAVHATLANAVADRMHGSRQAGVLASGGLDSSAVASYAAREARVDQQTLLAVGGVSATNEPSADEPHMDVLEAQVPGVQLYRFQPYNLWPLAGFDRETAQYLWPIQEFDYALLSGLFRSLASRGADVILSGLGGDQAISYSGRGLLAEFLSTGHPVKALMMGYRLMNNGASSLARILRSQMVGPLVPSPLWGRWTGRTPENWINQTFLNHEVARRLCVVERCRALGLLDHVHLRPSIRANLVANLLDGRLLSGLESMQRLGNLCNATVATPLLDRRLVELALSTPSREFVVNGQERSLLREGGQLIPKSIRWRRTKAPFSPSLTQRAAANFPGPLSRDYYSCYLNSEKLEEFECKLMAETPRNRSELLFYLAAVATHARLKS